MQQFDYLATIEKLAPSLAWPIVALLTLLLLRGQIVGIASNIAKLHDLMGRTGEIAGLIEKLQAVQVQSTEMHRSVQAIGSEMKSMSEIVESLNISARSRELASLSGQADADADAESNTASNQASITTDEMFEKIEAAWASVKSTIQEKAKQASVTSYLMGTKGVASTVDAMVQANVITKTSAELAVALSAQWQRFFRTSSPREEWLTPTVFQNFLQATAETKKALDRRVN